MDNNITTKVARTEFTHKHNIPADLPWAIQALKELEAVYNKTWDANDAHTADVLAMIRHEIEIHLANQK